MFEDAAESPKAPTVVEKVLFEHSDVHEANVIEILGFAGCIAIGVGTYHVVHDRGFPGHFAHDQQVRAISAAERNNEKLEEAKSTLSDVGASSAAAEADKAIAKNNAFVTNERANPAAPEYNNTIADLTSIGSAFLVGSVLTVAMFKKAHKMNRHYLDKKKAYEAVHGSAED